MQKRKQELPIVAIAQDKDEQKSLEKCLKNLPLSQIIEKGAHVVITPNWVKAKLPNTATVVGPKTLDKLIKLIKGFHPSKITIATGSGGDPTDKVMAFVGYDKIIEDNGVDFIDLNYGPYIDIDLEHDQPSSTKVNQLYEEMDVLISFTQLKMHEEATMSAGMKNIALGWPPAEIHGFPKKDLGIHEDLHGFITAMMKKVPIDLTIISADKTMIGTGPSGGKAVDAAGLMIAGTDPVATDAVGARLLGFLPQAVNYLYKCHREGVGEGELKNVEVRGLALKKAEQIFSRHAYQKDVILDEFGVKGFHGNK